MYLVTTQTKISACIPTLHHTINKWIWGRPLFYVSVCNMCMSLTSTLVRFYLKELRSLFACIWRKVVPWRKDCPPTQATLGKPSFHTFPYKHGELFTSETKSWRRRRVIPLALLERPTFLLKNTLAQPAMSTQSRRDNPSMCECCFRQSERIWALLPWALIARASFVHINGGELVKLTFLHVMSFYM